MVLQAVLYWGHQTPTFELSYFNLPLPSSSRRSSVDIYVDLIALHSKTDRDSQLQSLSLTWGEAGTNMCCPVL